MSEMLNAAIFRNGVRIVRNVNVEFDGEKVTIRNRAGNKAVMMEFDIEETASTGTEAMAWDIRDDRDQLVRLVAQRGCGCSGQMKNYEFDANYSMTLDRK